MARIRTVILDVDGTLVDSNSAHAHAWTDALRESGRQVPYERVRLLIGMGGDNLLPTLLGIPDDSDEGKRLATRCSEIFQERYLPWIRPFPKVREMVQRMRSDGLTVAIATSGERDKLMPLIERANLVDLIDVIVSGDDVQRSKPEPDLVLEVLKRTDTRPACALMLGDTPYDVAAALRAGVPIVGLRCGGWDDDHLVGTVAVYDSPATLLAAFESSPFNERRRTGMLDLRRFNASATRVGDGDVSSSA